MIRRCAGSSATTVWRCPPSTDARRAACSVPRCSGRCRHAGPALDRRRSTMSPARRHPAAAGPPSPHNSLRHEADVLLSGFSATGWSLSASRTHRPFVGHVAQREQRLHKLLRVMANRNQLWSRAGSTARCSSALRTVDPLHIMACRQALAAQTLRQRSQIGELHRLIAAHARHRRLAGGVTVGEIADHRIGETLSRHRSRSAGCPDGPRPVARHGCPGRRSTRPFGRCGAVVVELQRDADHLVTGLVQQPGDGAAVHAPDIATRIRIVLIAHHVAGAGGQLHHQAVQRLGDDDLQPSRDVWVRPTPDPACPPRPRSARRAS